MKKLVLISIITVFAALPFKNLSAQYAIPSYDVELSSTNATFEEAHPSGTMVAEKRKLNADTRNNGDSSDITVTFNIYNKETSDTYGPFTIDKDTPFNYIINDDEWGVRILDYDTGAYVSVWIN